jgi:hypothetical protein
MNNSQKHTARKEGLVIQEMPDEVLVFDLETNKAHCLNETAAFVWKACDGKNSVADITKLFGSKSGTSVPEDLVWLALDQLKTKNLIENKDEIVVDYNGMSRREVIRKVGLASVVALPLISSLVAPPAASAQSQTCVVGPPFGTNQANGCNCQGNGNCASNNCVSAICRATAPSGRQSRGGLRY